MLIKDSFVNHGMTKILPSLNDPVKIWTLVCENQLFSRQAEILLESDDQRQEESSVIARCWPEGYCDEIPTLENNWINWKTIRTAADIEPGAKHSQGFKV